MSLASRPPSPFVGKRRRSDSDLDSEQSGTRSSRFRPRPTTTGDILPPPTPDTDIYLPPFRVAELERQRQQQRASADANTPSVRLLVQRLAWEKLRKAIKGIVNRISKTNATDCVLDLLNLNLVRGLGLLCRSIIRAQVNAQALSAVYAAVVAAINTRLPELGELFTVRVLAQLKRALLENDRGVCIASVKLIAHLYMQSVVDALLPLEIVGILLANSTSASVELIVVLLKECGAALEDAEPVIVDDMFKSLRTVLQEGEVDIRVQYLVEGLMTLRRKADMGHATLPPELDLVLDEDRIVHSIVFSDEWDTRDDLDDFKLHDNWESEEVQYALYRILLLGEDDNLMFEDDDDDGIDESTLNTAVKDHDVLHSKPADTAPSSEEQAKQGGDLQVGKDRSRSADQAHMSPSRGERTVDMTEDDLVMFRRKVYLRIMSSASYEECAHKLIQFMREHKGREAELCGMIIECCAQERSFLRYYGLLGQQFCFLDAIYAERFEDAFAMHYATIHRYDLRKIRNMGIFYSFLLCADALHWSVFAVVVLTEQETTSSSRIFLSYIFKEMAKTLTTSKLCDRMKDERLAPFLRGMFDSESAADVRFSINFFTSIGLGQLTDSMRERLKMSRLVSSGSQSVSVREDN